MKTAEEDAALCEAAGPCHKTQALVSVPGVGVLNWLTLRPARGRSRARTQTGPVQSHRKKNPPVSPPPDWMHTLTALWLCIAEGAWRAV